MVSKTLEIFSSVYYVVYMDKKFQEIPRSSTEIKEVYMDKKFQEITRTRTEIKEVYIKRLQKMRGQMITLCSVHEVIARGQVGQVR